MWSGELEAPTTGNYVFEVESDDGFELWIDGVLVINAWGVHPLATETSSSISLQAGQRYDIEVYYLEVEGIAAFNLRWQKPGDSVATTVPGENLIYYDEATAATARKRLEFTYDATGRRIGKEIFKHDGSGWVLSEERRFLYDGWNLLTESIVDPQTSSFIPHASFVWGLDMSGTAQGAGGVGGLLAVNEHGATPATHYPAYDGNGNVMAAIAASAGTLSAEFEYDPFGVLLMAEGAARDAVAFRFSTKYRDTESGLLYYGHRYYSAETGRWLSRDPVTEQGGLGLYAFVGNRPIDAIDYLGNYRILGLEFDEGKSFGANVADYSRSWYSSPFSRDYWSSVGSNLGHYSRGVARGIADIPQGAWETAKALTALQDPLVRAQLATFLSRYRSDECFRLQVNGLLGDQFGAFLDDVSTPEGFMHALGRLGGEALGAKGLANLLGSLKRIDATNRTTSYGVSFFDSKVAGILDDSGAGLGRSGKQHFFMPLDDAAGIRNAADAARETGMAPSVVRAYTSEAPVYGVSFPTDGLSIKAPTAADAVDWPHFLEGGRTAVFTGGDNGGYLLNSTREFVTPGGGAMPSGSVLFRIESNGAWTPIRRY